jgi:hypothetical protein
MTVCTNEQKKSCVTINIHCGGEINEREDQLLVDIERAILGFKLGQIKEFRQRGGRLDVLDVTSSVPPPKHAGKLVCSGPIDGGGVSFARCVNNWFKDNSGGCGRIFHENGNWCFTEGC